MLRSVTDPNNMVYESPSKADAAREGADRQRGDHDFTVQDGQLVDTDAPTGTVTINDVDTQHDHRRT